MRATVQLVTVLLAALALAPPLAHVLELPGKLRLARESYLKVQSIYTPGFALAGWSEAVMVPVLLLLLLITPLGSVAFWLTAAALACFALMQLIFWVVVNPVNKYWLAPDRYDSAPRWPRVRDRWEYGHAARAALALSGLIALLVALKI
jgi:hypothetical protein